MKYMHMTLERILTFSPPQNTSSTDTTRKESGGFLGASLAARTMASIFYLRIFRKVQLESELETYDVRKEERLELGWHDEKVEEPIAMALLLLEAA